MSLPNLTITVTYPNTGQTKLSKVSPYNYCTVKYSCNKAFTFCKCMVTKQGTTADFNAGVEVYLRDTNGTASTNYEFQINSSSLNKGDGIYIATLYIQDADGNWNGESFFIVSGTSKFKVTDGYFKVPENGWVITIKAYNASTIYERRLSNEIKTETFTASNYGISGSVSWCNSSGQVLATGTSYTLNGVTANIIIQIRTS